MSIRLSDVGEYSQAVAENTGRARPAQNVVPMTYAREALTRTRGPHGLALTEEGGQPQRVRLNGLGELVQVVT